MKDGFRIKISFSIWNLSNLGLGASKSF